MNDFDLPELKQKKNLMLGLFIFAILMVIGFQILLIIAIDKSVTWRGICTFILQVATFYCLVYYVFPFVFRKGYRIKFVTLLLCTAFAQFIIRGFIIVHGKSKRDFLNFILSFEQVIFGTYQVIASIGIGYFFALYRRNEHLRVEYINALQDKFHAFAEKTRIESLMARSKLSPHLIFNTLNYATVNASDDPANVQKVLKLISGLMRHTLVDVQNIENVFLDDEIREVVNLIELYRMLTDGDFYIKFNKQYKDEEVGLKIPSSILLTLVENMVRYGIVKDPDYPACVSVFLEGNHLTFSTWNYKKEVLVPGTGLGIKSVESALNYYYAGAASIDIKDFEDIFKLTLIIDL